MNECMHVYGLLPEINITYLLTYMVNVRKGRVDGLTILYYMFRIIHDINGALCQSIIISLW